MKLLLIVIRVVSISIVIGGFAAQAQLPPGRQAGQNLNGAQVMAARQELLDSPLHQKVVAAGGKVEDVREAKVANLAKDLPSLWTRSDEVLLVHNLTNYGGLSASGQSVLTHYDVQVLRSWKGPHAVGDVVTVWVPAGGFAFPDGTQAGRLVRGFSNLRSGGRYLLFLHSSSKSENGLGSSLWLVGDGVQGAFSLNEEKVHPVYEQGALWKAYNQQGVPAFLSKVDALEGQP